ncbi:MAG TPA: chromosome segregation protein SMC [Polyangiaceae bacterium]|nr:chromosome segregation protein SMC [Polyangiaceae bacterium]
MHIRKLEISGFKSFVDRTVISFDHDVLAIVGPNGCGKSNIVDAIRWCMGEQSAKHLRGKSMEDVIFNGSESRGPHGMAEVTMTFDNGDLEQAAALPIEYRDYPEIAVTRRLYRDGTSQYLLNKTEVRLKDIIDVFLGTGVGTKAYSIVEQGKIGLIVSARAEDRRMLIEEAAGITKYKSRKKASERKMELTEQNLLRVGDRVAELERNVASLQRQAAKAERYVNYRQELDRLMLHQASHQLLEILTAEQFWSAEKSVCENNVETARTALMTAEAALEVERAAALDLEQGAEKAQDTAFGADNQVRAYEAEIARERDRLAHLSERSEAARREQTDLRSRAEALDAEAKEIAASLSGLEAEETNEAEGALTEHERLETLRTEERAAEAVLAELRARASKAASQVAAADAKLKGLERRTQEMQAREAKLAAQMTELTANRERLSAHRLELGSKVGELGTAFQTGQSRRVELEEELTHLKQALLESEKSLETERGLLAQQRGRMKALADMRERLEGVGDGVKHLMAKADPVLLGLVVDRVRVPAELTAALAGLLGSALECVVVSDAARAAELLAELARDKQGRASVIPQSPRRVAGKAARVVQGPGVMGPLLDRVAYAPEDEALMASLIGDALLVEDAASLMALAPLAQGRTLVALDGTVVHADGRVSGGSSDTVASGLVDEQRELRELAQVCAELSTKVEARIAEHQGLRSLMSGLGSALDQARQATHDAEIALVSAEKDQKKTDEQTTALEERLGAMHAELSDIGEKLAEGGHEQAEAERAFREGHDILHEAEVQAEGALAEAAKWRDQAAAQLSVVTDRKVRLARIREQVASTRGTVERLGRSRDELVGRTAKLEEELDQIARQTGETSSRLESTEEQLLEAVGVAQTAQAALSEARRIFDEARAALGEREAGLKVLRIDLGQASEKMTALELTLERLSINREHLLGSVREKFRGLDLAKVVGDYHRLPVPDEEHTHRISELTHLIERMGPVNLDATREHREEKERLTFFTVQKADLEKALDDLRQAIAQMNRTSKRLFRETFDAVNERFKALFPKLFKGGRAELHLTMPDDLLETGVEIIAQPPGKKLGNIELMSGGEKALTAVSLIFAIFQHKPSPFCILDEVDAPLDEANVARYNELIREMTDRSQFIVITHVRSTMQSVDVLCGVTMQEPGISRLVSVKINESAQRRSGVPRSEQDGEQIQVA